MSKTRDLEFSDAVFTYMLYVLQETVCKITNQVLFES
jgi:hypothetical protein